MMEQDVTPDEVTFNTVIDACASCRDPAQALQ